MIADLVKSDMVHATLEMNAISPSSGRSALHRTVSVELIRDSAVLALLEDCNIAASWTTVHANCQWATPFQSIEFARAWYPAYFAQYEPLLLMSRAADGSLLGLMPLALSRDGKHLVAAGDCQAEYQGWISMPAVGDMFAQQALQLIRREFPTHTLQLHYCPAGMPLKWLTHDATYRDRYSLSSHKRPLMRFGDGSAVNSSLSKKNNKSRVRAMKKLGEVQFRKLQSVADVEAIFDSIVRTHDSRRIAVNNIAPFADDPARRAFHLAMVAHRNFIHATALMIGDRVAAAQLNYLNARHVQLGLISYDPLLAEQSPGKMHILMLAKMLQEEGFEWLDITPGDDGYKQRFATDWDDVHSLTIFPNRAAKQRRGLIEGLHHRAKHALMKRDILPARAEAAVREFFRNGVLGLPVNAVRAIGRRLHSQTQLDFYSLPLAAARQLAVQGTAPQRDSLIDLMTFTEGRSGPSRQKFLRDAFDLAEDVLHVYTRVVDGRLTQIGWLAEKTSQIKRLAAVQLPRDCILLLGFKAFGSQSNAQGEFVNAMLHAATSTAGSKEVSTVIMQVDSQDLQLRDHVLRAGMKLDRSLNVTYRLGRRRETASLADGSIIVAASTAPQPAVSLPSGPPPTDE